MERGRGAGVRLEDAQRKKERVVSKIYWKQWICRTDMERVEMEVINKERGRGGCETEDRKRHGIEKSG